MNFRRASDAEWELRKTVNFYLRWLLIALSSIFNANLPILDFRRFLIKDNNWFMYVPL